MDDVSLAAGTEARRQLRAHGRAVRRAPHDVSMHLARLQLALQLPGSEPVQGVLADLFSVPVDNGATLRKAALQLAVERLDPYSVDAFTRHAGGHAPLPAITPLATRWSVLVQPSADVPARVRRGGRDDSRRLADEVVQALYDGELVEAARIEAEFLGHCVSCQDKLAFMLAMRGARKAGIEVDERWARVAAWLGARDAFGDRQEGFGPAPAIDGTDTGTP